MKKKKLRTRAEAREWLQAQGLTAAAWARANNFPVRVVQELLRDRAKGNYGGAHVPGIQEADGSVPQGSQKQKRRNPPVPPKPK